MIPAAVRRRYESTADGVAIVAKDVGETILNFCNQKGFPYVGRKKELASVAEKIETGRYASWSRLDDLFACTIVIPTLLHEDEVLDFLGDAFTRVTVRRRGSTQKPPDTFRFEATRFYGKLHPLPSSPGRKAAQEMVFEVQVRTAFEHAWSAATHDIIHKGNELEWRAHRLAAQLKAAVEQLDSLVVAFGKAAEPIVEHKWPQFDARRELLIGFVGLVNEGLVPPELKPKDWSRFAENAMTLLSSSKSFDRSDRNALRTLPERSLACLRNRLGSADGQPPLSVSLLQWAMAQWIEGGLIAAPLRDFHALVTPELVGFYPGVKAITTTVDLES